MKYVLNKYTNYFGNINTFLVEPFLKEDLVLMSNLINEKYFVEIADLTNSHIITWCCGKVQQEGRIRSCWIFGKAQIP